MRNGLQNCNCRHELDFNDLDFAEEANIASIIGRLFFIIIGNVALAVNTEI